MIKSLTGLLVFLSISGCSSSGGACCKPEVESEERARTLAQFFISEKNPDYNDLIFDIRLVKDRYWEIQTSLPEEMLGKSPYLRISKCCGMLEVYELR